MSEPGLATAATKAGEVSLPEGLVSAVVHLVSTGPVMLGAYTVAELTAVDAVVDFLESRPSDEVMAEAVRSLAARQLVAADGNGGQIQVRGDLGITVAFQRRARAVLDARVTGTGPGEPWRILLLPQPEGICLQIRIDALSIHQVGLYQLDEALGALAKWLPTGDRAQAGEPVDADALLAAADRTALLTITRYTVRESAETATDTTDLVLARRDDRLHILARDPSDRSKLIPRPQDDKEVPGLLAELLS
jgi:hypothetical protein